MSQESAVVCTLPNGCTLYRRPNGVGGFRYFSDEVGGGVEVWDTCLVDQGTLLCAMAEEAKRAYTEFMLQERRDREAVAQMEAQQAAQLAKDREERLKCVDRDRVNQTVYDVPAKFAVGDSVQYVFGGPHGFDVTFSGVVTVCKVTKGGRVYLIGDRQRGHWIEEEILTLTPPDETRCM